MVLDGTDKPTEDKGLCHRKLIFDILQVILTFSFSSTCMSELGYLKMRTEKKMFKPSNAMKKMKIKERKHNLL